MDKHTKRHVLQDDSPPVMVGDSPQQEYMYGDCFYCNGRPVMIHVGAKSYTMEAVCLQNGTRLNTVTTAKQGYISKDELIQLLNSVAIPIREITVTYKL